MQTALGFILLFVAFFAARGVIIAIEYIFK
jgi:hypothetical protein